MCQGITVKSPRTQYTRDQLLQWNTHNSITGLQSDFQFPDCIHRRDNFNSATGDKPCNVKKSFEKLVKEEIVMQTEQALDPLQFAYRAHRGVNDAIITLLNLLYKHLEGSNTHARLLFIDFSSAFNTIHPHICCELFPRRSRDQETLGYLSSRSYSLLRTRCASLQSSKSNYCSAQ